VKAGGKFEDSAEPSSVVWEISPLLSYAGEVILLFLFYKYDHSFLVQITHSSFCTN